MKKIKHKKNKMKFKRWGTLVPQKHVNNDDIVWFHDAPVELGIYAFPEYLGVWYLAAEFCCISNGRMEYVKNKDGKRIMMTQKEFDAIETKEIRNNKGIIVIANGHPRVRGQVRVVISPDFLRGMRHDYLFLKKDETDAPYDLNNLDENEIDTEYDEDDTLIEDDTLTEDDTLIEDDKLYPLMSWYDKLRKFSYEGNIWHHLEFTYAYQYWRRTPDGIKWSERNSEWVEPISVSDMKFKRLVKPEDIIRRSGSWILTDMRTYKKALKKAIRISKYNAFMEYKKKEKDKGGIAGSPMGIPKREINMTDFEVFIEKVK